MRKRTFGWIQNSGDIHKLKKITTIFLAGSKENLWLTQVRIPLLKDLDLISEENYLLFLKVLKNQTKALIIICSRVKVPILLLQAFVC